MNNIKSTWDKDVLVASYDYFKYGSYNNPRIQPNVVFECVNDINELVYGQIMTPDDRLRRQRATLYALDQLPRLGNISGELELNVFFNDTFTHVEMVVYNNDKVLKGLVFDLDLINDLA